LWWLDKWGPSLHGPWRFAQGLTWRGCLATWDRLHFVVLRRLIRGTSWSPNRCFHCVSLWFGLSLGHNRHTDCWWLSTFLPLVSWTDFFQSHNSFHLKNLSVGRMPWMC
jgi:hypothetical protein